MRVVVARSGGIRASLGHAALCLAASFAPCPGSVGDRSVGQLPALACIGALALPANERGLINGERGKVKRFP